MPGLLLGLGGYAFAGKDAATDVLERDHGFFRTYMSKPLERALLTLDPWVHDDDGSTVRYSDLHSRVGYDQSKLNPEVRRLLQMLGTEVGRRMFGENVWVDAMLAEVAPQLAAGRSVAVTGMRYRNEMDAIRQAGGVTVWVERPGFGPVNGHTSDNTLSPADFDVTIVNDGSLADLGLKVADLVGELSLGRAA